MKKTIAMMTLMNMMSGILVSLDQVRPAGVGDIAGLTDPGRRWAEGFRGAPAKIANCGITGANCQSPLTFWPPSTASSMASTSLASVMGAEASERVKRVSRVPS